MGSENGRERSKAETERHPLETECQALRRKVETLRTRRRQVHLLFENSVDDQIWRWGQRNNEVDRRRSEAVREYQSAFSKQRQTEDRLKVAQTWNVTDDCFYIWHRGPFGVINGLRLGSEATTLPVDREDARMPSGAVTISGSMARMDIIRVGYNLSGEPNGNPMQATEIVAVPWAEVNSALGLVAFLLSVLERKELSEFHFKNEIVAQGSTSKIGIRRGDSITYYDLFTDDNFHFFGKRNFNIALTGLVRCVAEAEEIVQERDRTIALPHAIDASPRGEMTIGGLPIAYGSDGEQWTRAMKYLLTNIKWLVAYTTKHVDR